MSIRSSEPLLAFQFAVEVSGPIQLTGYFTEVGTIFDDQELTEHLPVDHSYGKEPRQMIPGRSDPGVVSFKHGLTTGTGFWEWRDLVVRGHVVEARCGVSVIMFSRDYEPAARWEFSNAWPSKISLPNYMTENSDFVVEEMTIQYEGMVRTM